MTTIVPFKDLVDWIYSRSDDTRVDMSESGDVDEQPRIGCVLWQFARDRGHQKISCSMTGISIHDQGWYEDSIYFNDSYKVDRLVNTLISKQPINFGEIKAVLPQII